MNVLHLNQSDISGGAAIAGYRLHLGLLDQGIISKLLVGRVETNDSNVSPSPRRYRLENQLKRLTSPLGLNHINYVGSFGIPNHPFFQESTIVNFHNLHTPGFNYLSIPKMTQQKPAVFTLHDMWSFTGHCAYSYDCSRWKTGCGKCPYPQEYPSVQRDMTVWEWKIKDWVYNHADLTIITPSSWLNWQAKESMLKRFPIHHIPYGIDTDIYRPHDKEFCQSVLGIPENKKVLLFSAFNLKQKRKGGDLLIKSLKKLPESLKQECILLTFGKSSIEITSAVDIPLIHLGFVSSDRIKAIAYSASDLFILPTRADNLPLVLQESMACGTPMVSFDVGGVSDAVRPEVTGYLAKAEDHQDMCHGIVQLLDDDELRSTMSTKCREIAVREYSLEIQAQRYVSVYKDILSKRS